MFDEWIHFICCIMISELATQEPVLWMDFSRFLVQPGAGWCFGKEIRVNLREMRGHEPSRTKNFCGFLYFWMHYDKNKWSMLIHIKIQTFFFYQMMKTYALLRHRMNLSRRRSDRTTKQRKGQNNFSPLINVAAHSWHEPFFCQEKSRHLYLKDSGATTASEMPTLDLIGFI